MDLFWKVAENLDFSTSQAHGKHLFRAYHLLHFDILLETEFPEGQLHLFYFVLGSIRNVNGDGQLQSFSSGKL